MLQHPYNKTRLTPYASLSNVAKALYIDRSHAPALPTKNTHDNSIYQHTLDASSTRHYAEAGWSILD
ncbi:hypothetical protein TI04_03090 [Achromatium sp. WMS2]|nr:hypothetical protein TI04_03090 [Achromatium sp. WMS2]